MNDFQAEVVKTWKSSWNSYVKSLSTLQDQSRRMVDLYLSQTETTQSEINKLIKEGLSGAQEIQKTYLKSIEDGISRLEQMPGPGAFSPSPSSGKSAKS